VARGEAVYAYPFGGLLAGRGTLDSYYEANLAFVGERPPLEFSHADGGCTRRAPSPPVLFEATAPSITR